MADLEARREARRQKILQNAESRLQRLINLGNGRIPENECNLSEGNNIISNLVLETTTNQKDEDEEIRELNIQPNEAIDLEPTATNSDLLISHRVWVIVLLSMFIRYLNLVVEKYSSYIEVDITGLHINKIFAPLILYEILELTFLRPQIKSNNFLNTVLLLTNMQTKSLSKFMVAFNIFTKFFQDLLVYFFTFIICDKLIEVIF